MRPLQKYLSVFFLSIFVLASIIIVPQSQAADSLFYPGITGITQPKALQDYAKEFCDTRSGDLMNLETWYSGKCGPKIDTLSGEGVGFVDIIILQGIEWLNTLMLGSPKDSFLDSIFNKLNLIKQLKENLINGQNISSSDLAMVNDGGLIPAIAGFSGKLITTQPASSLEYISYIASNLKNKHIINNAYAASPGYGFTALSPILPLWRAFRNISYILFALGFVLYGVMIMFRIRIDAKTAASIQLAIPKLVITLLLITFSYAIVGFLIDISTVVTAMIINVLRIGGIVTFDKHIIVDMASGTYMGAVGSFIVNVISAMLVAPFVFFNLLIGGIVGAAVAFFAELTGFFTGFGIIISILIFLAVGYSYFKLILKLFQAYFSIIISLIFSPIILLGNLMPGSSALNSWLMSIIGNLAVFPVAAFFLVLSYALMVQPLLSLPSLGINIGGHDWSTLGALETIFGVQKLSTFNNIWTPPMTVGLGITGTGANQGLGLFVGGSVGSLMLAAIGFGLLMMASKYCEMVEKALKTPPFPYSSAIGEALKYGAGKAGGIPADYVPRLPGSIPTALTKSSLAAATWAGGSKASTTTISTPGSPPAPTP